MYQMNTFKNNSEIASQKSQNVTKIFIFACNELGYNKFPSFGE